jgi:hypothetical protein
VQYESDVAVAEATWAAAEAVAWSTYEAAANVALATWHAAESAARSVYSAAADAAVAAWQSAEAAAWAAFEAAEAAALGAWNASQAAAMSAFQAAFDSAIANYNATVSGLLSQAEQALQDCQNAAAAVPGGACTPALLLMLFGSLPGDEWRLDLQGHGGPHIQKGDLRWDARTFEPIEHKGKTPPPLTKRDFEELRKSGLLDKIRKNVPDNLINRTVDELSEKALKEVQKQGTKSLSKAARRELVEGILKKAALPVTVLLFFADAAEGGVHNAARNAVIPADLIEAVAAALRVKFDAWLEREAYELRIKQLMNGGLTRKQAMEILKNIGVAAPLP